VGSQSIGPRGTGCFIGPRLAPSRASPSSVKQIAATLLRLRGSARQPFSSPHLPHTPFLIARRRLLSDASSAPGLSLRPHLATTLLGSRWHNTLPGWLWQRASRDRHPLGQGPTTTHPRFLSCLPPAPRSCRHLAHAHPFFQSGSLPFAGSLETSRIFKDH